MTGSGSRINFIHVSGRVLNRNSNSDDRSKEAPHAVVIFTDAGGGHRAAAEALREILQSELGYRVTLVNAYQKVLPHLDWFRRWTRYDGEAVYNEMILKGGRTGLFCLCYYLLAMSNIRVMRKEGRRAFLSVWQEIEPDIVISVLPMLNGVIVDSLKDFAGGRVPTAVLITDWGEIARHTWFPKGKEYFAICGTEQSFRRLVSNGHPSTRVFRTTGLLIRPTFSHARPSHMARARRDLGLDPDCPTVCMLYGKYGGGRMITLARTLSQAPLEMQFIFLCGRDEETESALRAAVFPFRAIVRGFVDDVHRYLAVSDLFIGKPGGGSASEALAMGLFLLLDKGRALPQEKPLLRWVVRQRVGQTFSTPVQLERKLRSLLSSGRDWEASKHGSELNSASNEIPGIIRSIMAS